MQPGQADDNQAIPAPVKFQDYYVVLGVQRDADEKSVKSAYRRLALKWHPDQHQDRDTAKAEAKFKRISEAYEVLSDPEKRAKYDRFGENWKQGQDFEPDPGQRTMTPEEFEAAFGGSAGFSDFFQEMFGGQFRQDFQDAPDQHPRYRYRGADQHAELHLTISEALAGGKRTFDVPMQTSCPSCGGTGSRGTHVCPSCAGIGRVRKRRTVDLSIPDSIRDGLKLRLKGLGEAGVDGSDDGDLHLTVRLKEDDRYKLVGNDLVARVSVTPWMAHAGGKLDIRTARGLVTLTVPPDSRSGDRLRLRAQGFADGKNGHSDCIVHVEMDLPKSLTERQARLLQELAQKTEAAEAGAATEEQTS
ncbi:MAG: DnaJ-class molecular chaperone [Gammaproteobacteria bacterium]